MEHAVYRAARGDLVESLRQFAADRARVGKAERAAGATAAADDLAAGADVVFFERTYYEVGEPTRYAVFRGTRPELLAELTESVMGWHHMGKPHLVEQSVRAFEQLVTGAAAAQVGHLRYEVRD